MVTAYQTGLAAVCFVDFRDNTLMVALTPFPLERVLTLRKEDDRIHADVTSLWDDIECNLTYAYEMKHIRINHSSLILLNI